MNYRAWEKKAATGQFPHELFLAKLMEEVGEVANAYNEKGEVALLSELEHVEFIAKCFRTSVRASSKFRREHG
jgi:NTP pyrophosphatase (non-canonical NTP hydrolase)